MVLGVRFGTIQSSGGGGAPFVPTDIAGLELWVDASDSGTITEVAGKVSQWDDKTINGNDLIQGTGSKQPTTGTRTQNSKNVIDFNGSTEMMNTALFSTALPQGYTIFSVTQLDGGSNNFMFDNLGSRVTVFADTTDWAMLAASYLGSSTAHDTNAHAHGCVFNTTSSEYFIDGSSVATGTVGSNRDFTGLALGSLGNETGHWDGWFAEILIYDSVLSGGDITSVNNYLIAKWGI